MGPEAGRAQTLAAGAVTSAPVRSRVLHYYEETLQDYMTFLSVDRHGGMHYGYYDERCRRRAAAVLNLNAVLARRVGIGAGDRVLDAGCGIGGSSRWLARELGAHVIGVTLHEAQYEIAELRSRKEGLDHATEFRVADFCSTGLPDESVDVVWAIEAVSHTDKKGEFFDEAMRVLKPGGRLVMADGFRGRLPRANWESSMLRHWLEAWALTPLAQEDAMTAHATDAGFEAVDVTDVSANIAPYARFLFMAGLVVMPHAELVHLFGIYSRARMQNGRAVFLQYVALKRCLWRYCFFSGRKPR